MDKAISPILQCWSITWHYASFNQNVWRDENGSRRKNVLMPNSYWPNAADQTNEILWQKIYYILAEENIDWTYTNDLEINSEYSSRGHKHILS